MLMDSLDDSGFGGYMIERPYDPTLPQKCIGSDMIFFTFGSSQK